MSNRRPFAPAAGTLAALTSLLCVLSVTALAQTAPDAGSLLRENNREPTPLPPKPVLVAPVPSAASAPASGLRFTVTAFRLEGANLVPEAALQAAIASWLNRPIAFADLERAMQALADAYRSRGWLARPHLPTQDLIGGVVTIRIIESRLGEVRIDDAGRPLRFDRERIARAITARQQPGQPLRPEDLERAVNILNDTPGLHTAAVLAAGKEVGATDVVLQPVEQPLVSGNVQIDNESARATGADRLGLNVALDSPGRIGDQVLLGASTTGAGNEYISLVYSRPLGDDGWRAGASASAMRYRLGGDFASLDADGGAQTLGLQARYPLWRGTVRNAVLTLAVDRRSFRNDANGEVVSDKRLTSVTAGLGGDLSDGWAGSGVTLWGANLSKGQVDLSANAASAAADQAGPRTAGGYARLDWNLGRLQRVGERSALWVAGSGQFASTNLDSAEKFSLGGVNGVRAYPVLEGSGDSGWLGSAEWRYRALPELECVAFYDYGEVRVNQDPAFAGAAALNRIALEGAGVGMNWTPPGRYSVRAQLASRIGSNPLANPTTGKDSDGSLQRLRLWLSLAAAF